MSTARTKVNVSDFGDLITPFFSCAGFVNDLVRFDPKLISWALLSASGAAPSPRYGMGFKAVSSGKIYVFGGYTIHHGINSMIYLHFQKNGHVNCLLDLALSYTVFARGENDVLE
jgi:hypothetical protein